MLFLLKLLLVPALVAAITLAVRRWGPAVGGWLSGLPLVAGPVLVFYAIEQGTAFAAEAAHTTLAGLVGSVAFAVTYARASARFRWPACVAAGWTVFALTLAVLYALRPGLVVSFMGLIASTVVGRRLLPALSPSNGGGGHPRADLIVRLVAAAAMVLVLTGLARGLGPRMSGLLNAFPLLITIIAAFTHAQRGAAATVAFVDGWAQSIVGFALFCVVMAVTVDRIGLALALLCALLVQLAFSGILMRTAQSAAVSEA